MALEAENVTAPARISVREVMITQQRSAMSLFTACFNQYLRALTNNNNDNDNDNDNDKKKLSM